MRGDGVLVGGDEGDVAVLGVGELRPAVREVLGGDLGPVGGLAGRQRETLDLGLPGGHPRPRGGHLTGEPGQALAAVGERAGRGDPGALGLGEGALERRPLGDDGGQPGALGVEALGQLRLGRGDAVGLGVELVGIAAGRGGRRGGGEVAVPFGGQLGDPAEPLGQGRQPVPGVGRALQERRDGGQLALELRLAPGGDGVLALDQGALLAGRRLVGDVPVEGVAQLHQVVGEQPQPGVAQVGLHAGGAAGDLGLPAQRA